MSIAGDTPAVENTKAVSRVPLRDFIKNEDGSILWNASVVLMHYFQVPRFPLLSPVPLLPLMPLMSLIFLWLLSPL
jgi:hypothetical protein